MYYIKIVWFYFIIYWYSSLSESEDSEFDVSGREEEIKQENDMDISELDNSAILTAIYSDTSAGEGEDETTPSHAAE